LVLVEEYAYNVKIYVESNTSSLVFSPTVEIKFTCVLESGLPFQGFCKIKNRKAAGARQAKRKRTTEAPVCDK